ncbi:MAG: NIL domain-containing protein, partial [Chloroflexi bacterium]|nr:NIL domain-containing protein [Chloroflexota bacterium]
MQRVRLTFLDRLIKEPVVYQLGKKFDIVTNIRRADIQEGIGWVILELEGED